MSRFIKAPKKKRYDKQGNPIGDLSDYRNLMKDYGKLLSESRQVKEPRFSWGSPREHRKPPTIIEKIVEAFKPEPPSPKPQPPPTPRTETPPTPVEKPPKRGLMDKLMGYLPKPRRSA